MLIGIDASRAFLPQRTGIEEYSYQVIKHLTGHLKNDQVVLYLRNNQKVDFDLPANWKTKKINWPYLWTQIGLSLEMLFHRVDTLFIPAHTVPWIHPKNTMVAIHGLEYEFVPEGYSWWAKLYMRRAIKNSCRWAQKIIAVSNNTKQDLIRLYGVPEEKIKIIHEGYANQLSGEIAESKSYEKYKPYLFFIGRLEERKNIIGIIKTFEILKEKFQLPHKLVLAGKLGHGFRNIEDYLLSSRHKGDVVSLGFVSEGEKWQLMKNADVFMFPTFYEGFGIPVLEAQSMGIPVVTSGTSSMEEVTDHSAVIVDPNEPLEIAQRTNVLIQDRNYRDDIIRKGHENVKRFSWDKCSAEIAEILGKK